MTPVMLLSDGYIATGAEPWRIPDVSKLPKLDVKFHTDPENFLGYDRNENSLARPWAIPGTPGLEHRVGGLEKEDGSGNVCYDPTNHEYMCKIRAEKVTRIQQDIPPCELLGEASGDVLVVGWGGTKGVLVAATRQAQLKGLKVSHLHLRHLNPLPADLEDVLRSFKKVLVCELNLGQLVKIIRSEFLLECESFNQIRGLPFKVRDVVAAIEAADKESK
jgi:2-oxoglutarate ferredoxin oxidoreductase subunit alpha